MCGFTSEGYKSDIQKELIPYDIDIRNIKPQVIEELSKTQASGWSIFLINRSIEQLSKQLSLKHGCPNDPEAIRILSREVAIKEASRLIREEPKKVKNKILIFVKEFTYLINLIVLLLILLGIIKP